MTAWTYLPDITKYSRRWTMTPRRAINGYMLALTSKHRLGSYRAIDFKLADRSNFLALFRLRKSYMSQAVMLEREGAMDETHRLGVHHSTYRRPTQHVPLLM